MAELGSAEYPKNVNIRGYKPNTSVHMGQLKKALKMLQKAKKPLFLAGGGVNIANANEIFTSVVEKTQIPVVTTVMGRGAISTKHPLFIGNLGMHGAYAANMAVIPTVIFFFPSVHVLTIVSPVNSTSLPRMPRSFISISTQHLFPEISM